MKKIAETGVLLMMLMFAGACSKQRVTPSSVESIQQANPDNINMGAAINGKAWSTDSVFAYKVAQSGNDSDRVDLYLSATQKNDNPATSIKFNIYGYKGKGTYTIDPPANMVTYYVGSKRYNAQSGQIVFLNDTGNVIRGTFQFTADSFKVTDGAFTVATP